MSSPLPAAKLLLALLAVSAPILGCRDILGVNDFSMGAWVENPCGSVQVLVNGRCQDAGVSICGQGFAKGADGGCTPVLPAAACPPGWSAHVGSTTCGFAGALCESARSATLAQGVGSTVYVDVAAAAVGDGSAQRPFATIAEALASNPGELTLVLAAGVYPENVSISGRRVLLVGQCTDQTILQGKVAFGPGADGSQVVALAMTGGSAGVTVSGAKDVQLAVLWLHDLAGPAVVFDDVEGAASGRILLCLIDRARDAGISAYGATLAIEDSQIANTLPLREGERAVGILAGASPSFHGSDGSVRVPATLTLRRVIVNGSLGDGVLLDPANAEIADTVISDVGPDARGRAAGIETRAHSVGRIPTALVISRSLIERAHDVGIRSWNADLSLEDTVVREVGGEQSGRCRGNGIRARYDLVRDRDLGTRLAVHRSLIEGTRQAALHIEGGAALVEDSILRGSLAEPCRADFGDGLAAYASAIGPATVTLRRTRIERSARAAIASVGGIVTAEASSFECNTLGAAGSDITLSASLCGCNGSWQTCRLEGATLSSSLFGGQGCNANDDTVCYRQCTGAVAGATAWIFDHDEIASVLTDDQGCAQLEGAPIDEPCIFAQVTEGYANAMGMAPALSADATAAERTELIPITLNDLSMMPNLFGPRDLRTGTLLVVRVCRAPRLSVTDPCVGLTGITVELSPGPAEGPLYARASGLPDRSQTASVSQDTFFVNVAAGAHVVTLKPPDGSALACEIAAAGWHTEQPNSYRVYIEPSYSVYGVELLCSLSQP